MYEMNDLWLSLSEKRVRQVMGSVVQWNRNVVEAPNCFPERVNKKHRCIADFVPSVLFVLHFGFYRAISRQNWPSTTFLFRCAIAASVVTMGLPGAGGHKNAS